MNYEVGKQALRANVERAGGSATDRRGPDDGAKRHPWRTAAGENDKSAVGYGGNSAKRVGCNPRRLIDGWVATPELKVLKKVKQV